MNNAQELALVNEDLRKNKIVELTSLKESIKDLKINGIDDKEGYKLVYEAKNKVVKARTTIEKEYDLVVEDSKKFINNIKEAKNELLNIIGEEEKRLKEELQKIEDEKERIEQEEKEKAKKIFEERIKKLSEIKCIPDNLFAIGNMTDMEFELYYKDKIEEYNLKQKEQASINLINSSDTLEDLEELQHNDLFYWTDNIKEVFKKRFNEITEDINRKAEQRMMQEIININNTNTLEDLKKIEIITDREEIKTAYNNRKQFLEQKEELDRIKKEGEEKRKLEEEEENKKRKEKELRKASLIDKINSSQTEEELKELYFKEDIQDLIPEVKHLFTERKEEILKQEQQKQQQKEFQNYLQSINYNKEDCIMTPKNPQGEILIYKLIGKWKQ